MGLAADRGNTRLRAGRAELKSMEGAEPVVTEATVSFVGRNKGSHLASRMIF